MSMEELILVNESKPILWMNSMYESYPNATTLFVMNENWPNKINFSKLMNERIGSTFTMFQNKVDLWNISDLDEFQWMNE
jgi:hypothetical protein